MSITKDISYSRVGSDKSEWYSDIWGIGLKFSRYALEHHVQYLSCIRAHSKWFVPLFSANWISLSKDVNASRFFDLGPGSFSEMSTPLITLRSSIWSKKCKILPRTMGGRGVPFFLMSTFSGSTPCLYMFALYCVWEVVEQYVPRLTRRRNIVEILIRDTSDICLSFFLLWVFL